MIKHDIRNQLHKILSGIGVSDVPITIETPADPIHGDYSTNVAFHAAKTLKKSPMEVAEIIMKDSHFTVAEFGSIEKAEAVKPGFINFWIAKDELSNNLRILLRDNRSLVEELKKERERKARGEAIPVSLDESKKENQAEHPLQHKRILIEYAHPNTHKEMHIGHMRTLITGEALARLFASQGAIVFRANYQGDIGPHVAKAMVGIQELMQERHLSLEQLDQWSNIDKAHLLGEGYALGSKLYADTTKKTQIDLMNDFLYKKLEGRESETPYKEAMRDTIWNLYLRTRQWSLDYYNDFYTRFLTSFNRLFFESEMVDRGTRIVKEHLERVFVEDNGTIIFPGELYGLHTRVFITKAGYPTYEGKEMANGFAEYDEFPFDLKMHIVGNEQAGYFQVVFKALEMIDPQKFKDKQYHLPMGMVQFADRKMSSRTGDVLRVDWLIDQVKEAVEALFKEGHIVSENKETLLEEIAIGAIKYSVLKVNNKQDVAFDIKTSVSLQGNSGPYIQYTYARTRSIIRNFQLLSMQFSLRAIRTETKKENGEGQRDQLLYSKEQYEAEEIALLRELYFIWEIIEKAATDYNPSMLCEYLFRLAQAFNLFYQKHRILDVPDKTDRQFRVALTAGVSEALRMGLGLLGIAAPEKM